MALGIMIGEFSAEFLAHTWRWWGSMGAFLAIWPVTKWLFTFDPKTTPYFTDTVRWIMGLGVLLALIATLIAGAIIPWASDGRIDGFTQESPLFKQGMAVAWLFWGGCAWTIAVGFSGKRLPMIFASMLWWWAVFFAVRQTAGGML